MGNYEQEQIIRQTEKQRLRIQTQNEENEKRMIERNEELVARLVLKGVYVKK